MWLLDERSFDPKKQHHKETIFTIGNGHLLTRGAFEEGFRGERRATFVLGFYAWYFFAGQGNSRGAAGSVVSALAIAVAVLWLILNQYTFPFLLVQERASFLGALRNSAAIFVKWPEVAVGISLFNLLIFALASWLRFPWLVFAASFPALLACLSVKYSLEQAARPGSSPGGPS